MSAATEHYPPVFYPTEKYRFGVQQLMTERQQAEAAVATGEASVWRVAAVDKKIAAFALEHDDTGALKGEKIGPELLSYVKNLSLDKDGHVIVPEDNKVFFGMSTMTELSRLNAEYGHVASDSSLSQTVQGIEIAIKKKLSGTDISSAYEIFHSKSADFAYIVDGAHADNPLTMQAAVKQSLDAFRAVPIGASAQEGSPVASVHMSLHEAAQMFNELQDRLKIADIPQKTADEMPGELIAIWRKTTEALLDETMITALANRYLDMQKQNDPKAHSFYAKYVQKFFADTSLAAGFQAADEDERTKVLGEVTKIVERRTLRQLAGEARGTTPATYIALDVIADARKSMHADALPELTYGDDAGLKLYMDTNTVSEDSLQGRRAQTEKSLALATSAKTLKSAEGVLERIKSNQQITNEDLVVIQDVINTAFLPPVVSIGEASLTNIAMIVQTQDILHAAEKRNLTEFEQGVLADVLQTAKAEQTMQENRVDRLTGLPNRREYYTELEKRLKTQENVTTVFIDMGYLKLLNQAGRLVGNYGIQSVAEILEKTGAFSARYGGDEFTCLLSSPDYESFFAEIAALKQERGPIPRTEHSTLLYRPDELVFNFGVADRQMAEAAMEIMIAENLVRPEQAEKGSDAYYNKLAEVMTRMADYAIEEEKASSRIRLLLMRVQADFPDGIPETFSLAQRQTEALVGASQKAVYGLTLSEIHAMTKNPEYDMFTESGWMAIEAQLAEKKKISTEQHVIFHEKEADIIAGFVKETSLLSKIAELEHQLQEARAKEEKNEALIAQLQSRLTMHTEEKAALVQARQNIQSL